MKAHHEDSKESRRDGFWSRRLLRRRLIAGLVVIAPLTATLAVLWWIFGLVDGLLGRFINPALERLPGIGGLPGIGLPGLGALTLLLLLLGVGWAAERTVGSRVLASWHALLERIPVTRRIYGAANRIVRTMFDSQARPFKTVVLVEYPAPGRWSIGFLAADAPHAVDPHVTDSVSVFVPTTPNPTSGWLVIVPRDRVVRLSMTIDEAFTYVLSAGSVRPERAAERSFEAGSSLETTIEERRSEGGEHGSPAAEDADDAEFRRIAAEIAADAENESR